MLRPPGRLRRIFSVTAPRSNANWSSSHGRRLRNGVRRSRWQRRLVGRSEKGQCLNAESGRIRDVCRLLSGVAANEPVHWFQGGDLSLQFVEQIGAVAAEFI